ncbi:MAG: response regulator transcription factor [Thermodesulfobacteriota bacterium]|nr:response regulator transcription factor [Thermodesulfobacteriota bacterium]
MKTHVLVIEDEVDILDLVKFNLEKEGFKVSGALNGEIGLESARGTLPDLVILDLMLPGVHGLEVCRILKNDLMTRHIPIVMLTAKGENVEIVTGLNAGADDYITKPFSPRVMLARIHAVLRRSVSEESAPSSLPSKSEGKPLIRNEITIHPGRHEVIINGKIIQLTATEFRILYFLAAHPGWVKTRDQIVSEVHSEDYHVTRRAIDVQIVGLRKKLGSSGKNIETVRGVGYRFKD